MMDNMYGPLVTPDGRTVYLPSHLVSCLWELRPVDPVYTAINVSMTAPQLAPVSFPEFVEQTQEPVVTTSKTESYQSSCEIMETTTLKEIYEMSSDITEVIPPVVIVQENVDQKSEKRQLDDWEEDSEVSEVGSTTGSVEQKDWLKAPKPKKHVRFSDDVDDSGSVSSAYTAYTDDTMRSVEQDLESDMMTRNLPVYVTKVPMRVRSDCTSYAPEIDRLQANTRVHLLEIGIENFPTSRLCHWWRQTFEGLNWVVNRIKQFNIDGREMADFAWDTQRNLDLSLEDTELVKKALALVSRKAQIVFEKDGVVCRGWVSRIKSRKSQMCRIFKKSKPTLVVSRMRNDRHTLKACEDKMENTFEALNLKFQNIRFATHFRKSNRGSDSIREGRRTVYGNWKPRNHCMIEFKTHKDAAIALQKLTSFSAYPLDFEPSQGYSLHTRDVKVGYAKEYANLETVSVPSFV